MSRRRPPRATSRTGVRLPHRGATAYRRVLARHPSIHWLVVAVLAVATGAQVLARDDRVEQARRAWGDTREVLVADRDAAPGEPLVASVREIPAAVVPPAAIDATGVARIARQHVGAGEIVTDADVAALGGPLPLLPPGWLAVPGVESPPSGATVGDRVLLASDGVVLAPDAVVVGQVGDVTLVGVPADGAPSLPPAAASGSLTVLRQP
jgi:hypothetical protein